MRLEKVSPEELIQAAVEELRSAAATGGVTVHAEFESSLPAIPMDRERMLHVLTNLLSNAIKYSPNGGRVIVRAQFHVDSIRVSVSDNGPGVPAQYHSRIFEKFFRVPGTPKTGAGLGLSIAREFIRAHRGQIGVQSEPGRGSEFYFLLPLD
jgi:signal transduction histidine kinase